MSPEYKTIIAKTYLNRLIDYFRIMYKLQNNKTTTVISFDKVIKIPLCKERKKKKLAFKQSLKICCDSIELMYPSECSEDERNTALMKDT